MRIIQLTDIHLGFDGEYTRGVDSRKNFLDIIQAISAQHPDLLVITGDICYKAPFQEIYDWVEEILVELPFDVRIIGGNHDDIGMIPMRFLPIKGDDHDERYFDLHLPLYRTNVMFLDTHSAVMSETQLSFLRKKLQSADKRVVIFMHHPPVLAGVGYMDINHAFRSREKFAEVLREVGVKPIIFTGHYHVEKTIVTEEAIVHITPSTFFQIKQDQPEFAVDHHNIAYRLIDLSIKSMMHRVEYLPGNLLPDQS
jgi:Icc protein